MISPQFQLASDQKFSQIDIDKDGLVNGAEIKDILLQSGLNQQSLASIWFVTLLRSPSCENIMVLLSKISQVVGSSYSTAIALPVPDVASLPMAVITSIIMYIGILLYKYN